MDFGKIKSTGIQAAHRGAAVLMDKLGRLSEINKKGVIDLVTDADTASEKVIIETIQAVFPAHTLTCTNHDGVVNLAFLYFATRYRVFNADLNDIAYTCVPTL